MRRSLTRLSIPFKEPYVTSGGVVPSREDIAEAERIAAAVDGVTSVRNELRVGVPNAQSGSAD